MHHIAAAPRQVDNSRPLPRAAFPFPGHQAMPAPKPNPNDRTPRVMRGWCGHCRQLSVLESTGKCEHCGGAMDRRHEWVECGY